MSSDKIFRIATNRNNLIPHTNIKDLTVNLLKNIVPNSDDYVKPEHMIIWHQAFTHETFDPTYNYEDKEYKGDRNVKVLFPVYLYKRNPLYTKKDLTNIDTLVMEMKTQYDLSFELGFIDLIKMPHHTKPTIGVGGDVFESFFGALDDVSDMVLGDLGLINSYNMICYIFNQNIIPDDLRLGNSKMIVEQIFIQLGLKNPSPIFYNHNGVTVTLKLTQEHLDFFHDHHININPIIATAKGTVKHATTKVAYDIAKTTLENAGVTEEFIEKIKLIKNVDKEEVIREKIEKEKLSVDIKTLVEKLISPIINEEEIPKYITKNFMKVWDKIDEEDEMLTYFGEIILKGFLAKHLMNVYKDDSSYNKEDFNNIITNIIKNYDSFLVTDNTSHLKGGVLKNFFGALMQVSNDILDGVGLLNCYRMIVLIFDKALIPYEYRYKHPKTAVEQLFSPFFGKDKSKPLLNIIDEEEGYTFEVSLTDEQLAFLKQHGFKIKDKLLARYSDKLKKNTQKLAYEIALKKLEDYGINKFWAIGLKNQMEFNHPKIAVYQKALNDKMKKDGYDFVYFASPSKTTTNTEITIQLVGVKNGKKTILSSVIDETGGNKLDYKILLIKNYLQYY